MTDHSFEQTEVTEILRSLYLEKKKGKEQEERIRLLERDLEASRDVPQQQSASEAEVRRLEQLIAFFKSKYEQAAEALVSSAGSEQEEEISALQEQMKHLRREVEEALDGKRGFETRLNKALEEKRILKQQLDRLHFSLQDANRKYQDLQELETSVRKAHMRIKDLEDELQQESVRNVRSEEEMEKNREALAEALRHNEQLERVIQFLRERGEASQLELKQFQLDYQAALSKIEEHAALFEEAKQACFAESARVLEERAEKEELQQEIEALQEQLTLLRQEHDQARLETEGKVSELETLQIAVETKGAEIARLTEQSEKTEQTLKHAEEDLEAFRGLVNKQSKEFKDLQTKFLDLAADKNTVTTQLAHAQQLIEALKKATEDHEESSAQAKAAIQELEANHQRDEELMRIKNDSLEALQGQLDAALIEKQQLAEALEVSRLNGEENDARLKVAQQHLAKKVKEVNELTQAVEELRAANVEVHTQCNQLRLQLGDLKSTMESGRYQEIRLQEQLQEHARSSEVALQRWEEKYLKAYEKWQEAESRIRELKKMEERYQHMQSLLSNLGNFIGAPLQSAGFMPFKEEPLSNVVETTRFPSFPQEPPEVGFSEPSGEEPIVKPFQNLFDLPAMQQRAPRQDFFD